VRNHITIIQNKNKILPTYAIQFLPILDQDYNKWLKGWSIVQEWLEFRDEDHVTFIIGGD